MILPSLRRFYSTPIKPKANLNPNPFALGRPVSKRQPKPAARTPDPPRNPKSSTDGEIARPNLSPLSKKIQQWRRDLSDRKGADGLAEVGVENGHDWTFNSILQILRQCALYSLGIFVVGHLFITHVFDLQATLGASMLPTLYYEGDWVLINKLYRRGKGVQVGDLVEAKNPLRADGRVLKRVIGMPGDFVVAHTTDTDGMMLQVPRGHCFLAGDNQCQSRDSRLYGPVPLALITGKVSYRVLPLWRTGPLENTLKPVDERELDGSI